MTAGPHSDGGALVLIRMTATTAEVYSLEETAELSGIHADLLRYYCRLGLMGTARSGPEAELRFDRDAVEELRCFEDYRRHHRIDRATLRLICGLRSEVDRLRAELRVRRDGWSRSRDPSPPSSLIPGGPMDSRRWERPLRP